MKQKRMTKQYIIDLIRKLMPDALTIYLTGSRAEKFHKPDSDWDIRVVIPHEKMKYKKYQWHKYQSDIDCTVLHDFDVGELEAPKLDVFVADYGPEKPYKVLWVNKKYEHHRKHLDFLKVRYLRLTTHFIDKYRVDPDELKEVFDEVSHVIRETKQEIEQQEEAEKVDTNGQEAKV